VMADKVCALTIAYAVAAALVRRERTGRGQHLEVPMVEAARAFMLVEHGAGAIAVGGGPAGYSRVLTPQRRPQQTTDGWINVLPYSGAHYDALFREHRPDLLGDVRYSTGRRRIEHSDFLYEQVRGILATRTTDEWVAFCRTEGIPCSPVVTLDELVDELPVVEHPVTGPYRHVPAPVRFDGAHLPLRRPASLIGQDTADVLAEVGIDRAEVDRLSEAGVLGRRDQVGPSSPPAGS
jgi:crotonobetainyl-CoA:carnitine CoA-transferase CaiB-like acyl-CoA transferase